MKLTSIISACIICGLTLVVFTVIIGEFFMSPGCGCVSKPSQTPIFSMDFTNDSASTYVNLTYLSPGDHMNVSDLKLVEKSYNSTSISYVNDTLVPGNSYWLKADPENGTRYVVSVLADGQEMVVNDVII